MFAIGGIEVWHDDEQKQGAHRCCGFVWVVGAGFGVAVAIV